MGTSASLGLTGASLAFIGLHLHCYPPLSFVLPTLTFRPADLIGRNPAPFVRPRNGNTRLLWLVCLSRKTRKGGGRPDSNRRPRGKNPSVTMAYTHPNAPTPHTASI